ncbi:hypothetical protein FGB62_21g453 [Gracilaria domingensis]|nr:hypothetical protein FGB62_21g453 [Gracilaria domingensis]
MWLSRARTADPGLKRAAAPPRFDEKKGAGKRARYRIAAYSTGKRAAVVGVVAVATAVGQTWREMRELDAGARGRDGEALM